MSESRRKFESVLMDAYQAFATGAEDFLPALDAWVDASPEAAEAYLARGMHLLHLGWHERGEVPIENVSPAATERMESFFARAEEDFDRATELDDASFVPYAGLLLLYGGRSDAEKTHDIWKRIVSTLEDHYDFHLYESLMLAWRPRFGGSYGHLDNVIFVMMPYSMNPRLRALRGLMSWENAQEQIVAGDLGIALTRISESVGSGPYHRYFHVRGMIYFQNFQYEAALDEIDNGLLLAPQDPDLLFWRARVLLRLDAFDEAKEALALAMELDANHPSYVRWAELNRAELEGE